MSVLMSLFLTACGPKQPPVVEAPAPELKAPVAEQRQHVHTEHGVERPDPYYWMRDREDPAVIAYLEAENAWTQAQLAPLQPLRQTVYDEMLGRIQEDDEGVPYPRAGYWYYWRTEQGKPYPLFCRRQGSLEAEEEVYLDQNALAEGVDYLSVGLVEVSPDHRIMAYSVDTTGREVYELRFRDLETGEDLPDSVSGVNSAAAWSADSRTFFYGTSDEALRPHRIWRHTLGESEGQLVYEEADEKFRVFSWASRSGAYIFMHTESSLTSEVWVVPADAPAAEPRVLSVRHPGMEYQVAHQGERWLILTNDCDDDSGQHADCAVNRKIVTAPLDATDRAEWTDLVPHDEDVYLSRAPEAFRDFFVVQEREEGVPHLRVVKGDESFRIPMPEPSYRLGGAQNAEYDTPSFRYAYSSLITPTSTYAFDLDTRESVLLRQTPVNGYNKQDYVAERVWATGRDGTMIPVSLVHRADLDRTNPQPTLLYAYGSYGATMDPYFRSQRLSLLDRGVVFALAHVRGGSELGRQWYEDGKLLRKKNTFEDFIAAAEYLVDEGYTAPDRLAIDGRSAGGLLIGAVLNERPDLFHVAVAGVPFVDVVTTMFDASIPLTANEWEEWGDPREKEFFDYMLSYSPYDNVSAQDYPHLLITSGLNDPRVQYWEPTKWTARLRALKTDRNTLLLETNMEAGHGGASGRYGRLQETARTYAFVLDKLSVAGVSDASATP